MESFSLFVVVVTLLSADLGETGETVDDYFRLKYGEKRGLVEHFNETWFDYTYSRHRMLYEAVPNHHVVFWNLTLEVLQYSDHFYYKIILDFSSSVANVTLQSVRQDLNVSCGESLDSWWTEITNETCVKNWLKNWMEVKFQETVNNFPPECSLQFCSRTRGNVCTSAFVKNSVDIIYDQLYVTTSNAEYSTYTLDDVLYRSVFIFSDTVTESFNTLTDYHNNLYNILISVPSIEPFKYDNLFRARFIHFSPILYSKLLYHSVSKSRNYLTWVIIQSSRGNVENMCSYPRNFIEYTFLSKICYRFNTLKSHIDLLRCAYKDEIAAPLSWSTVPSAFFHSQCLCLAFDDTECGVQAPGGVEPLTYCLSVLLRDFQRQVSFRPAHTYLDYVFMTKVPISYFTNLLQHTFHQMCRNHVDFKKIDFVLSVQCSFYGLVNDTLNCSEISMVNSYNASYLCNLYFFMDFVACDADADASVPFYPPGASTLVQVLAYLDVSIRTLTLVTYLSCPQLRNLPGKLLIGYLVTALLRLLVVRASLEDLAVAVRIDVASDLSSTLWLTSYLHFLTTSFRTLTLPDSLSPQEARCVLLRYSLLGWALPAALSASSFFLDEAIQSHVQLGQLLFGLFTYVALFGNLFMFCYNCHFYYGIKKDAVSLKPGVKSRTVFTGLLNFALKTSVLVIPGLIFRVIFLQIKGLENTLGYSHLFGPVQGLLIFLSYGCNRESRDFWRRVLCQKLLPCQRPQNRVV